MDWFTTWWNGLDGVTLQVLYCIAIPGTIILIIQTLLLIFGIGGEGAEFDTPEIEAADLTTTGEGGFGVMGLFTFQGIVAFFCVLGWSGVVFLNATGSPAVSVAAGILLGFGAMLGVGKIIRLSAKLQHVGNINMKLLIGETGTVYIPIPDDKTKRGKVNVQVGERMVECEAISEGGALATNTSVRVTDILAGNILIVEKI
jgi:hypothetical protein